MYHGTSNIRNESVYQWLHERVDKRVLIKDFTKKHKTVHTKRHTKESSKRYKRVFKEDSQNEHTNKYTKRGTESVSLKRVQKKATRKVQLLHTHG